MKKLPILLLLLLTMAADVPPDPSKPITLSDGTQVELLGLTQLPDQQQWWNAAGVKLDAPCDPFKQEGMTWTHAAIIRVTAPQDADVAHRITVTNRQSIMTTNPRRNGQTDPTLELTAWKLHDRATTADLIVEIASGDWKIDASNTNPNGGLSTSTDAGTVAISPLTWSEKGFAQITVSWKFKDNRQMRIVAFDDDGKDHLASGGSSAGNQDFSQTTTGFDIPPYQIKRVEVQTRPYARSVRFTNLPMSPGEPSQARVDVKDGSK